MKGNALDDHGQPPKRRGGSRSGRKITRLPLDSLAGLIKEAGAVYRQMKANKLDHEKGRARVWVLAQIRAMLEAQELQKLTARLEELQQLAERRYGNGHGREPQRLIEAETLTN